MPVKKDTVGVPYALRLRSATTPTKQSIPSKMASSDESLNTDVTWGRAHAIGWLTVLGCFLVLLICPMFVIYVWSSCTYSKCEILTPALRILESPTLKTLKSLAPVPSAKGFALYFGWLAFQAALYVFLPGKIGFGQRTPAGHLLPYVVNGLSAWIVTHVLFIGVSLRTGWYELSIIHDYWGPLLVAANVYGYGLALFSYLKANYFPSHPNDRKFSGSMIYDFFMGIEFNPRFGKYFDFKLFHNGRPGIIAWTLINFSFAAAQYKEIGYVTNSMILLNFLHLVYVLDFFYNEDWYLRTIDIAHDHFGFYLAWGDSVWLPYMYTIQSHFLVRNPIDLSWPYFAMVFVIGMSGYYVFRSVNHQKDIVRSSNGNCNIWGKPCQVIRTEYQTSDGEKHRSLLLVSGFWGLSRHFNYVGDLLISMAMCMSCGFHYILPYFYVIYMTILLLQRIERKLVFNHLLGDQQRCQGKYGKFWDDYCAAVPFKLIPFIY